MPSRIPDFEYDVFVSYRQNDNKYDGWVTEFVANLRKELEATSKDPISVYFDENPHDGIRETHQVDKSLERKLRCLIFLPILSKTYCDSKSYAWTQEFIPFRDLAARDSFGPIIPLRNGNAASRILPVRIHDLDVEDQSRFEKETGGPLRAVDFVFKTPGVNRPLRASEDHPQDNLNKTYYRDQINKVANAVNEMLIAMTSPAIEATSAAPAHQRPSARPRPDKLWKGMRLLVVIALLLLGGYAVMNYKQWIPEPAVKSLAVLPFKNLSTDPKDQYLADGFYEEIINRLSKEKNLVVLARASSTMATSAGWGSSEISQKLNVQYILTGSLQKEGDNLKITVRLEDGRTGQVISSKTLDRKLQDYFVLLGEVANKVVAGVGETINTQLYSLPTDNLKAWEHFLKAFEYEWTSNIKEISDKHVYFLESAIREDPMMSTAWYWLENYYFYQYGNGGDSTTLQAGLRAMEKVYAIDKDSYLGKHAELLYLYWVKNDYPEVIRKSDELQERLPNDLYTIQRKSLALRRMGDEQGNFLMLLKMNELDPLQVAYEMEIAKKLIAHAQTREARPYLNNCGNVPYCKAYYYSLYFNSYVLEHRFDKIDSLILQAEQETAETFGADAVMRLKNARNAMVNFYSRQYLHWPLYSFADIGTEAADATRDSAMLFHIRGETEKSRLYFAKAKEHWYNLAAEAANPQSYKRYRLQYALCMAGLGESDWESEFISIKNGLPALEESRYYQAHIYAYLVNGQNDRAMKTLKEHKEKIFYRTEDVPDYYRPFILLKDNPFLDPIRRDPGFEELWEGNHLKLTPLKFSKD
jgi:TolB-like protein